MKRETLGTTRFVGIFNNRRVRTRASFQHTINEESEDGLAA
jgi:hypothetical protein